ncbi:MAG: hypothetical protein WCS15_06180 [Prevotella sp.]
MTVSDQDRKVVLDTIGTFRSGASITVDDIRFAAKVDGYDLSHILWNELPIIIKDRCDPYNIGGHKCVSWIRRY